MAAGAKRSTTGVVEGWRSIATNNYFNLRSLLAAVNLNDCVLLDRHLQATLTILPTQPYNLPSHRLRAVSD